MKNTKINQVFDRVLYGLFLVLPFLLVIIYAIRAGSADFVSLTGIDGINTMMEQSFGGYMDNTFIYGVIDGAIGADGVAPLVNTNTSWLVDWLSYAVTISVLHLLLDCLIFFPSFLRGLMHHIGWCDDTL